MKKDFATFLTYSGKEIDIQNFKEDNINVNDIFHALSFINRFTGHSHRNYSVAEHSIYCFIVARKLELGTRIEALALLHDASEAYVGDMPTYVKQFMPSYKDMEDKVEEVIFDKLGLILMTPEEKKIVKKIDNTLMLIEMRDLTQHDIHSLDLKERDNFYEDKYGVYDTLVHWEYPIKRINLEFGSIIDWLPDEKYVNTFLKYGENTPLAYEKLMKHIYKEEVELRFGGLKSND